MFNFRIEIRHRQKLKHIGCMHAVNFFLCFFVINLACSDISVEHSISKAEVIFVGFTAKTVDRCFFDKIFGQTEIMTYRLNLLNRKVGERTEITRAVTVA